MTIERAEQIPIAGSGASNGNWIQTRRVKSKGLGRVRRAQLSLGWWPEGTLEWASDGVRSASIVSEAPLSAELS